MFQLITRSLTLPTSSLVRLHSSAAASSQFLNNFMSSTEKGPVQTAIEQKITDALQPSVLQTINESHLHAHHVAMKGNTNKETHFRVTVVSEQFQGKSLMQRHRMIYGLLSDELNQGLHALSLKTKTPAELEKAK
ncbi:bola protein [Radiomyces spectabilis]|uniref:bola protein n=1 Tax=Radiomyces spectabilis TaxID=64574 RepID=UPI002220B751|nr:bola protein [Radiomyces spectabilis]KAI8376433.1 bola protein [Radiomyces spectabilis]